MNFLLEDYYFEFFNMIMKAIYKSDSYIYEKIISKDYIKGIEYIYEEYEEDENKHIYANIDFIRNDNTSLSIISKDIPAIVSNDALYIDLKNNHEKDLFIYSIKNLSKSDKNNKLLNYLTNFKSV